MLRTLLAALSALLLLVAAPLVAAIVTLIPSADATAPSFALWVWCLTGLSGLIGMVVFGLTVGRAPRRRRSAAPEPAVDVESPLDVPAAASFA